MKSRMFALAALVVLMFSGCKKYPEDDKRYFSKSPKKRIAKTWKVNRLLIDDADSTARIYKSYITNPAKEYTFTQLLIKFKEEKHSTLSGYYGCTVNPSGVTASQSPAWNFINSKSGLTFFFDNSANYTNSFQLNTKSQTWSILKLTESELIIITTEGKRKIKLMLVAA